MAFKIIQALKDGKILSDRLKQELGVNDEYTLRQYKYSIRRLIDAGIITRTDVLTDMRMVEYSVYTRHDLFKHGNREISDKLQKRVMEVLT